MAQPVSWHTRRVYSSLARIVGRTVERDEAVDRGACLTRGECEPRMGRVERVIVGHADGVDARSQAWVVGDAFDRIAVHVHAGLQVAQGFAVIGGGHQHGGRASARVGRG